MAFSRFALGHDLKLLAAQQYFRFVRNRNVQAKLLVNRFLCRIGFCFGKFPLKNFQGFGKHFGKGVATFQFRPGFPLFQIAADLLDIPPGLHVRTFRNQPSEPVFGIERRGQRADADNPHGLVARLALRSGQRVEHGLPLAGVPG